MIGGARGNSLGAFQGADGTVLVGEFAPLLGIGLYFGIGDGAGQAAGFYYFARGELADVLWVEYFSILIQEGKAGNIYRIEPAGVFAKVFGGPEQGADIGGPGGYPYPGLDGIVGGHGGAGLQYAFGIVYLYGVLVVDNHLLPEGAAEVGEFLSFFHLLYGANIEQIADNNYFAGQIGGGGYCLGQGSGCHIAYYNVVDHRGQN